MNEMDCGLRIVDCGMERILFLHQRSVLASNLARPIRNPQSEIPNESAP
jgi:hypothetical protein